MANLPSKEKVKVEKGRRNRTVEKEQDESGEAKRAYISAEKRNRLKSGTIIVGKMISFTFSFSREVL